MNNIESIRAKINAANETAIAQLLEKAKQEGAAILAQTDAKIAELNRKSEADTAVAAAQIKRIAVSSADLAVKKELLGAKQRLIAEAFDAAVERLCAMDGTQYAQTVIALALACPPAGGVFRLAAAAAGKTAPDLLQQVNAARAKQGKQPYEAGKPVDTIAGGFVVEGENWRQVCSFESLVAQQKEELEPLVAGILFGEGV